MSNSARLVWGLYFEKCDAVTSERGATLACLLPIRDTNSFHDVLDVGRDALDDDVSHAAGNRLRYAALWSGYLPWNRIEMVPLLVATSGLPSPFRSATTKLVGRPPLTP